MDKISRRNALKWMGLSAATLAFSPYVRAEELLKTPRFQNPIRRQGPPQGMPRMSYAEPVVYEGPDVVIRQIDAHTWEGNGHRRPGERGAFVITQWGSSSRLGPSALGQIHPKKMHLAIPPKGGSKQTRDNIRKLEMNSRRKYSPQQSL